MENDEFIAREKAMQYARNVAPVPSDSASDHCAGFLAGWKAARDHLAAQAPKPLPDESELGIYGDWLVVLNAHEPDYPAGPEWGPYPGSEHDPLFDLSRVAGYPPEPQEPTDAEVEDAIEDRLYDAGLVDSSVDPEGDPVATVDAPLTEVVRAVMSALAAARAVRQEKR